MQVELENEDNTTTEKKVEIDLDTINAAIRHASPFSVFKRNVKKFFKLFGFSPNLIMTEQDRKLEKDLKQNFEDNAKYLKVSEGFDRYLENDLWKLSVELVDNGYLPSKAQQNKLMEILSDIVSKDPNKIIEITQVLKYIPIELITSSLINNKEISKNESQEFIKIYNTIEDKKEFIQIIKQIDKILNKNTDVLLSGLVIDYSSLGCIGNINATKINKYLHNIDNTFNFIKENGHKIDLEPMLEYKQLILTLKEKFIKKVKLHSPEESHKYYEENVKNLKIEYFDSLLTKLNLIVEKKFSEDKEVLINQARQLNTDKFLENKINTSVVEHILSVERELPKAAQDLLKVINDKYYAATKGNSLPEEVKHEVQNLYENRLPEVLKKFMVIDPEYRIELKNIQGKNAEQLMLESLKNIEEVLDNQIKVANEARLSDLSVTQRYTSAIKNKM